MNPYGVFGTDRFDLRAIDRWNTANQRAMDNYYLQPSAAKTEDLCSVCCHPRYRRRCGVCRSVLDVRKRMRDLRARRCSA